MKKLKIRKGVFETNSSSSHSVSIADTDKQFVVDMGIIPDEYGVVTISGGDFGWEWEKINDARTKADYCAVYCQRNQAHIEMLIDVIKEQTGASEVDLSQVDGYIDHQSNSTASEAFVDKSTLRNFIFNKNSWLFTGNDNGSQEPSYYHVDEYRDGKIFPPTYKFELIIDGLVKTTKFIKKPTKEEIEDGIYYVLNGAEYNGEGKFKKESNNYNSTPKFSFNPWHKPIDFDGGKIFFVKEKEAGIEAKKIFKEKNGREFSDKDYQEINKIKNSLYSKKNSEYCEAVNFSLRDMKTDLAKERIKSLEN